MTRRRMQLGMAALTLSCVLAFFLRDVAYSMIVVPLAYLFALLAFYYSFIPQLILWILMLMILALTSLAAFTPEGRFSSPQVIKKKPVQGPVELLATWMIKGRKGIYFKWLIAHRLGRLNRELGGNMESGDRTTSEIGAVEKYLDAGLNKSFADYPYPAGPFAAPKPTPLDLHPKKAIDYLESKMEPSHDRDS